MPGSPTQDKLLVRIDAILDKHSLKKTTLRRTLLLIFAQSKGPFSQGDVITALANEMETVDRVSVYRNLNQLKEAGLLHEVNVNSYVFCSHECDDHAHLLLFCQQCHQHREIKDHDRIKKFMSALSDLRFFNKDEPVFIRGICSTCANTSES